MDLWLEIVNIAESILFTDEPDSLIWTLNSKGLYSVQSLYAVVNFRGVRPVYPNAIWGLCISPGYRSFFGFEVKKKLLTRDNLAKRREVSNKTCLFCSEPESITHAFFECCVVKILWSFFSVVFDT